MEIGNYQLPITGDNYWIKLQPSHEPSHEIFSVNICNLTFLCYFNAMFNFLKGRLKFIRLCLLIITLTLITIGIATIYAVGHPAEPGVATRIEPELSNLWKKQLMFALLSLIGFVAVNLVNYRRFGNISYWIFAGTIVLLAYLLVSRYVFELPFAPENEHKAHCWLVFHPMLPRIQPSEFFKLAYILTLAWYLRYRSNYRNFRALIGPFLLTLLPIVLILLEPDLGTVVLMMPILFTMLFIAGAKVKHLLIIVLMAILVSPLLWCKMRPYQRIRISSVLLQSAWVREKAENHPWLGKVFVGTRFNENLWKSDWGWHLIRVKYAIASGGIKGFGFRRGPFVKYDFLKERHNDFIFAIIAQQWGFWGCIGLLMLYAVMIGCGLEISANNTDPFGRLLAIGIIAMFTGELLVNVSMTLGLMPITGLTLPFISYGGSSLLVNMASVGLLNNVGRCRPFSVARKT
ncbi:MAG: rod shape-determining protein RodA [Sedimentisphaerales bacterium]|nr:rod shape-determining protein RodA [Sedimentisphaerales bacterium]